MDEWWAAFSPRIHMSLSFSGLSLTVTPDQWGKVYKKRRSVLFMIL